MKWQPVETIPMDGTEILIKTCAGIVSAWFCNIAPTNDAKDDACYDWICYDDMFQIDGHESIIDAWMPMPVIEGENCDLPNPVIEALRQRQRAEQAEVEIERLQNIIRRTAEIVSPDCPDIDAYVAGHCGLPEVVERLKNQIEQYTESAMDKRIAELEKLRVHCPLCGGDYAETGLEVGCNCVLTARIAELEKKLEDKS
jgi:hypothetical protein